MLKKKSRAKDAIAPRLPKILADNFAYQLDELVSEKKILLAGESVFITDDEKASIPEGYLEQPVRYGINGIALLVGQKGKTLRVAVAAKIVESLPKVRFGYAFDGYLNWGLYQTRPTIVIGGALASGSLMIDILVFDRFKLIEKDGRVLPPEDSPLYDESIHSLVNQLREKYPAHRIVVSAPLHDFGIEGVGYISDSAIKRVSYVPIQLKGAKKSFNEYRVPAAVVGTGLAFYVGALVHGWMPFSAAQVEYKAAIEHPAIKAAGGVDQAYLGVMQQRRLFMEEPRRQEVLSTKAEEIVIGVAKVPDVRILELKLPAPSVSADSAAPGRAQLVSPDGMQQKTSFTPGRQPDVSMTLSVPMAPGPALDQARAVMELVSSATGLDLRLNHKGPRDDNKGRRIFEIEGVIRD